MLRCRVSVSLNEKFLAITQVRTYLWWSILEPLVWPQGRVQWACKSIEFSFLTPVWYPFCSGRRKKNQLLSEVRTVESYICLSYPGHRVHFGYINN